MSDASREAAKDEGGWPRFVPLGAGAIVGVNLAAAVLQRREYWRPGVPFGYKLVGATLAATLAFLPFLLDGVGVLTNRSLGLPLPLFALPVVLGIGFLVFNPVDTDFAPFVLVFTAAEVASRAGNKKRLGLLGWALGIAVMIAADVFGRFNGTFVWVVGITFGWFGGFMVGQLDARKQELEDAQAGLAEKAATDERARIAREVHDVIAHSLSVTMLHVSAARMALERGDRATDALDALREAEQQGRRSMAEIRRTVGLLGPDETGAAPPQPGVTDLPKLVSEFQAAGLDVTLAMQGDVVSLPPTAGLSIYRVVQESLTNVVKHSSGSSARVELYVNDDDVRLRVNNTSSNGGPVALEGGGLGVRGMIERASVLDGDLFAGPDGDGWTVLLTAPRPVA